MQYCFKFLCTISLVGILGAACKKEGTINPEKPVPAVSNSGSSCGKPSKSSRPNGSKKNKTVESLADGTHKMAVLMIAINTNAANKNATVYTQKPGSVSLNSSGSNSSIRRISSADILNEIFDLYPLS